MPSTNIFDRADSQTAFRGELRPSQQSVVDIATREFESGKRKLHIVAPPGSGKTVLGLYLWAIKIRKPCLILSPNSAIQSQWAARTDLFELPGNRESIVSTDPDKAATLNSLTYQSVTMPSRNNDQVDEMAMRIWCDKLIEEGEVASNEEAVLWMEQLREANPNYYNQRSGIYRKKVRDDISISGDSMSILHSSSLATLERMADANIGLLILDECHHLMGHWGRVLSDALTILNDPIVIGLTATPPDRDGKDKRDIERYDSFFGPIDFEVPVPAVVKDGFLSPFQDLAYFVRPTANELKFIASADQRLAELVEELCQPRENEALTEKPEPKVTQTFAPDEDETRSIDGIDSATISPDDIELATDPAEPDSASTDNDLTKEPEASSSESLKSYSLVEWVVDSLATRRLPMGLAKSWASYDRRDTTFSKSARQFLSSISVEYPANVPSLPSLETFEETPQLEYWVPVIDRYVRHYLRRSSDPIDHQLAQKTTGRLRMLGVQITETGTKVCASPVGRVLAYSQNKAAAIVPILKSEMKQLGDDTRAVVIADFEKSSAVSAEIKHLMDKETGGAIAAFKAILSDPETDLLDPILITGQTILIDDEIEIAFLDAARAWLKARGKSVEFNVETIDQFRKITGKGSHWSPRVYVEMITELFQQGLTRCLVGTRGLLGEGWDANKINVLIDLTTVTTSMTVNQLRGRSIRLDPAKPEKLANNWDVVCLAPEFSKGFDDYRRFRKKHQNLYGVTDDGLVEKGVGHVHPAFTELKPEGLEESTTVLNSEMLQRAAWRPKVRELWNIGQPYQAIPVRAIEVKHQTENEMGWPPFGSGRDPWTSQSLTQSIANAVLSTLIEVDKASSQAKPQVGQLSGSYIRVFLKSATEEESHLFAEAMREIMGPLDKPRYIIERHIKTQTDTWLSSVLPDIIGKYFVRKGNQLARLHAIPTEFGKNKKLVSIFEKHWNLHVSPGKAVFAQRGEGEQLLAEAKQASTSTPKIHDKEIFL